MSRCVRSRRRKLPQFFDEHVLETLAGERIVTAHRLPVFGGDGEIRYLLTLMSDVTNRHLQTREIEEMKTFLDTVIENVPVSIIVRDARDLRCILANRAAEELHGISRDKIIGTIASNMYPGGVGAKIDESARAVLKGRKVIVIPEEKRVIAGKGERIIAATRVPVLGNNGEPRYLMTVAEDITERRQAQARIAHLAHHDSLTDLPNRAAFAEHFTAAVERARSEKIGLVVMCMDLDHFKEVNDVFGHAIGDALLCQASRALCDAAGESFVARLGGDEFALVSASAASPEAADHLAQALTAAVNREFDVEGHKLQIGLSVGVALFPNDGEDTGALFANADAALYRAKADGRGVIRFFEPSMDKKLRDQRALSLDLRYAVDHGELMLYYQPQAQMDGTIVGFEALARWHHPMRGFVPPSEFIPLAEESGLIFDLGEWVLRSACREAASWPNQSECGGQRLRRAVPPRRPASSRSFDPARHRLERLAP